MTEYVFFPPNGQSLTWSNTALWAGGAVPDSATADVYIAPVLVSQTAQSAAFVLDLPAGQSVTLGAFEIGGNTLQLEGSLQVGGPAAILGGAGLLIDGGTPILQLTSAQDSADAAALAGIDLTVLTRLLCSAAKAS